MVTTYTVLKSIHILAVATWIGGGSMVGMLVARARREQVHERLAGLVRVIEPIASRVFPGAGLVLLITGFWLIYNFGWPYDTWVILGLVGFAYSFIAGAALIGPTVAKAVQRFDENGASDEVGLTHVKRLLQLSRIDSLVLTLVVLDMVIKPGT